MAEETEQLRSEVAADVSDWVKAITALTKLTQTGHLHWRRATPSEAFGGVKPDGDIEFVYIADYKEYLLRLYEEVVNTSPFKHSPLRVLWENKSSRRIVLEMVDVDLKSLFTFPQVNALAGLLSAVKFKVSDVKEVLDGIVKEADLIETQ